MPNIGRSDVANTIQSLFLTIYCQIGGYMYIYGKLCTNFPAKAPDRNLKPCCCASSMRSIYLFMVSLTAVVFMASADHEDAYEKVRWRGVKARAKKDAGVQACWQHLHLQQVPQHLLATSWITMFLFAHMTTSNCRHFPFLFHPLLDKSHQCAFFFTPPPKAACPSLPICLLALPSVTSPVRPVVIRQRTVNDNRTRPRYKTLGCIDLSARPSTRRSLLGRFCCKINKNHISDGPSGTVAALPDGLSTPAVWKEMATTRRKTLAKRKWSSRATCSNPTTAGMSAAAWLKSLHGLWCHSKRHLNGENLNKIWPDLWFYVG